jgi:tRNA (adenine57-N1/adenine58-N1)-methyltransferase
VQAAQKAPDARPQAPTEPERTDLVREDSGGTENAADGLFQQPAGGNTCRKDIMMRLLQEGDRIHLVDHKDRHYALTLKRGKVFQHSGETICHDDLIGQPEGIQVTLSRGSRMTVLRPALAEYVLKMPRGAQVIYPKDLGIILMWADIYPGARVLEAGAGSGALTMALLRAVGEKGRVFSYEVREDFAKRAQENVRQFLGEVDHWELHKKDIAEGILEQELDRVILDLPEPWQLVPQVEKALRSGGILLSYLPTIPQVQQLVEHLRASRSFDFIETIETLLRPWNIDGRSVRPDHRMVAHTGFITTARKITHTKRKDAS